MFWAIHEEEAVSLWLAFLWLAAAGSLGACDAREPTHESSPPPVRASGSTSPSASPSAASAASLTPNAFYALGTPTFIVGTAGSERTTRDIALQAELLRASLFPDAKVVTDTSLDVSKGAAAWPPHPVVYGGTHVNTVLRSLDASLPVHVDAERIVVGGETFEGPGLRFIGVIPAHTGDKGQGGHPAFVLYAGTGDLGTAEINAVPHGRHPLLVADAFGPLVTGTFEVGTSGVEAVLDRQRARRIDWRDVLGSVTGTTGSATMTFRFPKQLDPAPDEAELVAAGLRGVTRAVERLELASPSAMQVYVYPDPRSKQSLTGQSGDGHAVAAAGALHVVRVAPSQLDGFERLIAHEATHVLTAHAFGQPATPLLGEGVAVWVSGGYAGERLADHKAAMTPGHSVSELLGPAFRKLPEKDTYPFAGLLVAAAVDAVGLAGVRDHLYRATPESWADACQRAGTTAEALERAVTGSSPRPQP